MKTEKLAKWQTDGTNCTSLTQYHIAFCVKFLRPVLEPKMQRRVKQLIKEKQKEWNFKVISLTVTRESVQTIVQSDPHIGIDNLVSKIKGHTARVLKAEFPKLTTRLPNLWTRKRLILSIGSVEEDAVNAYIQSQKNV